MPASPPAFTVFTPTYNRVHTLHRVYESLHAQAFRDFEWVVIDDGSTDGTADVVKGWVAQSSFSIRYFWQENQGKHVAHNRACAEAQGELMHIVDSDDAMMPSTLARFWFHWQSIDSATRDRYSGIVALCQDQHGQLVSPKFPRDVIDMDGPTMRYVHHLMGEYCGCTTTALLRSVPFPETKGLSFISESYVWDQISRRYLFRCINEVLRVYYQEDSAAVKPSSLSKQSAQRNARAHVPYYEAALNLDHAYFGRAPMIFLRFGALYTRFGLHAGLSLGEQWRRMHGWRSKLIWLSASPIGIGVYLRDLR